MGLSRRSMSAIVAVVSVLVCLEVLWTHSAGAEQIRIVDGSNVTFLYQITVPGEPGFGVRKFGQFVQGRHHMPPAFERVVTGMKTGDEKKIDLSAEEGFGPYDTKKRKLFRKAISHLGPRWEISLRIAPVMTRECSNCRSDPP